MKDETVGNFWSQTKGGLNANSSIFFLAGYQTSITSSKNGYHMIIMDLVCKIIFISI